MKAHSYKQILGNLGLLKLYENFGRIVDKVQAKNYENLGGVNKGYFSRKSRNRKSFKKAIDWNN